MLLTAAAAAGSGRRVDGVSKFNKSKAERSTLKLIVVDRVKWSMGIIKIP